MTKLASSSCWSQRNQTAVATTERLISLPRPSQCRKAPSRRAPIAVRGRATSGRDPDAEAPGYVSVPDRPSRLYSCAERPCGPCLPTPVGRARFYRRRQAKVGIAVRVCDIRGLCEQLSLLLLTMTRAYHRSLAKPMNLEIVELGNWPIVTVSELPTTSRRACSRVKHNAGVRGSGGCLHVGT